MYMCALVLGNIRNLDLKNELQGGEFKGLNHRNYVDSTIRDLIWLFKISLRGFDFFNSILCNYVCDLLIKFLIIDTLFSLCCHYVVDHKNSLVHYNVGNTPCELCVCV